MKLNLFAKSRPVAVKRVSVSESEQNVFGLGPENLCFWCVQEALTVSLKTTLWESLLQRFCQVDLKIRSLWFWLDFCRAMDCPMWPREGSRSTRLAPGQLLLQCQKAQVTAKTSSCQRLHLSGVVYLLKWEEGGEGCWGKDKLKSACSQWAQTPRPGMVLKSAETSEWPGTHTFCQVFLWCVYTWPRAGWWVGAMSRCISNKFPGNAGWCLFLAKEMKRLLCSQDWGRGALSSDGVQNRTQPGHRW